jgi:phage tail sheath protein FI
VYVEEVASAVQPIAGVGTSTAGFVGRVADDVVMPAQPGRFVTDAAGRVTLDQNGKPTPVPFVVAPAGEPQLITSWEQFKNAFGDFQIAPPAPVPATPAAVTTPAAADAGTTPAATGTTTKPKAATPATVADVSLRNRTLAHAVYGFFNNGGTRCWVTRVLGAGSPTDVQAALDGFKAIDEIALVIVPGATDDVTQKMVVEHCKGMGDRFAILDGSQTDTLTVAGIAGGTGTSDYAAMYFPWISVWDPSRNKVDFVPPSGHIAGIFARVDGSRGVHKAPANEVVRGAVGLQKRLSIADQNGLNPDGINLIRDFGGDIKVWGARTLGGDANGEWKYVNVRRLFLFLRKSIDHGTHWVVFEPNTPALWAKITRNIVAFLTNVWRDGALFGATPQEAFYVKCDASTNPPELRDLGQVVTEIGVAVVRPAEFVIFRISQWQPGA